MKYYLLQIIILSILGACKESPSSIQERITVDEKRPVGQSELLPETNKPVTQDTSENAFKIAQLQERFGFTDSIELIRYFEDNSEGYDAYEYVFLVPSSNSPYHKSFQTRVTFDLVKSLKYAHYDKPSTWPKTDKTITEDIRNKYQEILSEWVELKYYNGELTLSEFHSYYFYFSDSLFVDNTWMEGPFLYNYTSIEEKDKNQIVVRFKNLEDENNGSATFYFLTKDLALIEYKGTMWNGISSCKLMTRKSALFNYPLITVESSDEPEDISMMRVDCDSIKSLSRFN